MSLFKIILSISILLATVSSSQDPEGIKITVRKGHKKITYIAENLTNTDIDLFFKVTSKGFRRSTDRPLITTIPAKTKKDLLTLIPLKDADTTHTYIAVITKPEFNVEIRKTDTIVKDVLQINPKKGKQTKS